MPSIICGCGKWQLQQHEILNSVVFCAYFFQCAAVVFIIFIVFSDSMFKFLLTIILIGIILCLPIKILVVVENCHQCLRVYGSKIAYVPHLNSRIADNLDMWTPQKSRNMSNGYRL